MPTPTKPGYGIGWMGLLASQKRSKMGEEIKHIALVYAKALFQLSLKCQRSPGSPYMPEGHTEIFFTEVEHQLITKLGWTEEQFQATQKAIIHLAYGDPIIMASNGLKQHMLPYWNPTRFKINISPMGLVKSVDEKTREASFYEFLEPGEHIMIPHGYTVGGKHSTVNGVAPQLRPLPREVETELDLHPFTYTEWCAFGEPKISPCCKKVVAWSGGHGALLCTKCGSMDV